MKTIRNITGYFFLLLFCFPVKGQNTDSVINKLMHYIHAIEDFSTYIPQEKVYLHFDNTSYYRGDRIWYKCYVVTSGSQPAIPLSKTLYVELLNPGGEVIGKQILKIENGQCHGNFVLNRLPFYSGFYEVRAYTKYMLNFGEDIIFSRLLPVFDKPAKEGHFEEKKMRKYGTGNYPVKREKPVKAKKINVKFFPEGGNLVQGLTSQVALEATDAYGNPLEITGNMITETGKELFHLQTGPEGRGIFNYMPSSQHCKIMLKYKGKNYSFELPAASPQGIVLRVDNLSSPDSIDLTVQKNSNTLPGLWGMAVMSWGKLQHFCLVDINTDHPLRFRISKANFPSGVSRILLFNSSGQICCDRLFFVNRNDFLRIKNRTNKKSYSPYEQVNMEFTVTDPAHKPVATTFSLSVRDGENEVESGRSILTDLLLISEIKGVIHHPSYYFEADDSLHRKALDLLLMVQGWRRYSWEQMTGLHPFKLKYLPEQGIEIHGEVISFVKETPKPNIHLSSCLLHKGENADSTRLNAGVFTTDSLGRFSFISDIYGKWDLVLAVTEKGKRKNYRIILDRTFSPLPRRYPYAEMQVVLNDSGTATDTIEEITDPRSRDTEYALSAYEDSLPSSVHRLEEVTVTGEKRAKEKEIYRNRTTSVAYYDVHSELDNIKDSGKLVGEDIHRLLLYINENFRPVTLIDSLSYKGRKPLFVINYESATGDELDRTKYKLLRLEAIKSIYINENLSTICQYADPRMTLTQVDATYSCVIFIETYPEGMIPTEPAKGVRKTAVEGYSRSMEFYSPDYSVLPHDPDYRRTLYWNPSVTTTPEGKASVRFYNNSRCRKFSISAETITPQGIIGIQ